MHENLKTFRWSEGSPTAYVHRIRATLLSRLHLNKRAESNSDAVVVGLPAGVDFQTLDHLCRDKLGDPLEISHYQHLSSWKPQGAFRLFLETRNGTQWTVIFKQTVATSEFNPILDGLPVVPGPAEFAIYQCGQPGLARYLPQCFVADEVEPGRRYMFIQEDLGKPHRQATGESPMPPIEDLVGLHNALDRCVSGPDNHLLIDYLEAADRFIAFFRQSLEVQVEADNDRLLGQLLNRFEEVEAAYRQGMSLPASSVGIVHGDPNLSNVHISALTPGHTKFLDWEWAGINVRHIDLAAMLKFMSPRVESESLKLYARLNPSLSLSEHRLLYYWAKLDRSLLDLSLM